MIVSSIGPRGWRMPPRDGKQPKTIHSCGRFQSIAMKIEKGGILTIDDQTLCVGVISVMLLFKNWQRPGAVVNMTQQSKGGYSGGA